MAAVQRKNITHKWYAMVDWMIANPTGSNADLAAHMNMAESTISIIKHSDAFKSFWMARQDEKTAELRRLMNDRLLDVGGKALDIVAARLEKDKHVIPLKGVMEVAKPVLDALGFGARPAGGPSVVVNNNNAPQTAHISLEDLREAQQAIRDHEGRYSDGARDERALPAPAVEDAEVLDETPSEKNRLVFERMERRRKAAEHREFWSDFPEQDKNR